MPGVDQKNPRDCYVYGHSDAAGRFFYIGKGSGRRAWSRDRDKMWHHYVDDHLRGVYNVVILADGLAPDAAEVLESEWIARESAGLVNRQNMARAIDIDALTRREELIRRSKTLADAAKSYERADTDRAIELYKEAYSLLKTLSRIQFESGLYAKLEAELDPIGQISLLDRLTLCLIRRFRKDEARLVTAEYFSIFKSERSFVLARRILKRVGNECC